MITFGFCAPGQERLAAETDGEIVDYEVRVVDLDDTVVPGAVGPLEDLQGADVHRHVAVLREQERGRRRVEGEHHETTFRRVDPARA